MIKTTSRKSKKWRKNMLTKSISKYQQKKSQVTKTTTTSIGISSASNFQHQKRILNKFKSEISCGAKLTTMEINLFHWQKLKKVWEMSSKVMHCLKLNLQLLEHSISLKSTPKEHLNIVMTILRKVNLESSWLLWESGLNTLLLSKR